MGPGTCDTPATLGVPYQAISHMAVSDNGVPQLGWFMMENPQRMIWGYPYFRKAQYCKCLSMVFLIGCYLTTNHKPEKNTCITRKKYMINVVLFNQKKIHTYHTGASGCCHRLSSHGMGQYLLDHRLIQGQTTSMPSPKFY